MTIAVHPAQAARFGEGGRAFARSATGLLERRRARMLMRRPWRDLVGIEYFDGLGDAQLKTLRPLVEWCPVRSGTSLQRRGRRVQRLWIPVSAVLETRIDGDVVDVLTPPAVYGEAEVLLGRAADVDVVATTPGLVLELPASAFHGMLGDGRFAGLVARRMAVTGVGVPA